MAVVVNGWPEYCGSGCDSLSEPNVKPDYRPAGGV